MITLLCWFWQQPGGRTRYQPWHVNLWAAKVREHLSLPHRIACVTDTPQGLDPSIEIIEPPRDFEHVRIPTWKEARPQCLRRLAMFAPDAGKTFGERIVCMDIDCVIGGSLDLLFDRPEDFVIFKGTAARRPYNGSMFMLRAGSRPQVYTEFTPEAAAQAGRRFVGSDQAWIMDRLGPGEATWDERDGVDWWWEGANRPIPPVRRVLFTMGHKKPWDLTCVPDIARHYRLDPQPGWCMVLGRGRSVWDDADRALDRGRPTAVIVQGEAEQHWPGRIDAVAVNDTHAREIAAMMGFANVVMCGELRGAPETLRYSPRLEQRRERRLSAVSRSSVAG